ncbi:MAG: Cys-Gln thioester bond-forming surface protein [Peptococcaceae bacterium]|nr:Cys-Gln thioester bond-forming surface protein [Peptococcaceae bacterium]
MKKKTKKLIAMFLLIVMCMGLAVTPAFAKEVIDGNDWYGDELSVDVTAGTEGYTFMSLFRKPVHGYEFSGHFMGEGEGPQTFVVLDTVKHHGTTWTPSGLYESGSSNYEVLYCCDVETIIKDGTYYKRLNLEDSEYYNEAQAAKIRAVVTNSYPYVSLEEMKADLAAAGFPDADKLTRNEIIAAVQCAIWACANDMDKPLEYAKSYKVSDNLQWGYPLHDTSSESKLDVSGKRVFKTYEDVGKRIDGLVNYLLTQKETYAEKKAIVISELKITDAVPVIEKDGVYKVAMQVALNNSGSDAKEDDIHLEVTVDGTVVDNKKVTLGTETYDFIVEAEHGQTIKAVVSGTQVLPNGVYFYAPKPEDTNNDGVATSREVSQNLVGAAFGKTSVYAEESVTLEVKDSAHADLALLKTDESGNPLTGAEFALYVKGEKDSIKVETFSVDVNGELKIEGLLPGEYRLRETKSPEGYSRLNQAIVFTVDTDGNLDLNDNILSGVTLSKDDNDVNKLTIVNNPVVPNEGDITVEKTVTGNMAPNKPFNFTLFVKEQKVSPFADEMADAYDDLLYVIDNMDSAVKATTGSVYTIDGTTLSQYIFTLNGKASMAITSGSALEFNSTKELQPTEYGSPGELLGAVKAELLKAYNSLMDMLEGLRDNVIMDDKTVVIEQEALESVLKARQLYNDAKSNDAKWQAENTTASALQITFGDRVYTPDDGLQYDAENKWWKLDFQVAPGEEYAANIHVKSTTGSSISYTISETVVSNGYYIDTEVLDTDKKLLANGASLGEWITLNDNGYYDSYVFRNNYKTITDDNHWYEDPKKEEKDPKPPVIPEEIIDDPDVPLGDIEVPGEPAIPDEELEDSEIPLGDAPATGDTSNAVLFVVLMLAAMAGLVITRRKFN